MNRQALTETQQAFDQAIKRRSTERDFSHSKELFRQFCALVNNVEGKDYEEKKWWGRMYAVVTQWGEDSKDCFFSMDEVAELYVVKQNKSHEDILAAILTNEEEEPEVLQRHFFKTKQEAFAFLHESYSKLDVETVVKNVVPA